MSKIGIMMIFTLGIGFGAVLPIMLKKGRVNMSKTNYIIDLKFDGTGSGWVATSNDVPGLILMSESLDDLREQVNVAVPELLRLNKIGNFKEDVKIIFNMEKELVPA